MSCAVCGATRARLMLGRCVNEAGCNRRRIDRRIREDKKRGGPQCMAPRGSGTITFCVMRLHHEGLHARDGSEWGDEEATPIGLLYAEAFRPAARAPGAPADTLGDSVEACHAHILQTQGAGSTPQTSYSKVQGYTPEEPGKEPRR
jgi:hypothetical protein